MSVSGAWRSAWAARLDPTQTITRQAADDFAWPETENTGALYFQDKFSIDHLFWPLNPVFRSTGPQRPLSARHIAT
uniref:Uncharacterized protein n=1 Tax=mine drainage metagenome TaxID=410659 RepID=E6QH53_9ZZZZ